MRYRAARPCRLRYLLPAQSKQAQIRPKSTSLNPHKPRELVSRHHRSDWRLPRIKPPVYAEFDRVDPLLNTRGKIKGHARENPIECKRPSAEVVVQVLKLC